jgi:hypothetical protein
VALSLSVVEAFKPDQAVQLPVMMFPKRFEYSSHTLTNPSGQAITPKSPDLRQFLLHCTISLRRFLQRTHGHKTKDLKALWKYATLRANESARTFT